MILEWEWLQYRLLADSEKYNYLNLRRSQIIDMSIFIWCLGTL